MNRTILKRHIRLSSDKEELARLEAFIEQVCDDYHIYDAYYGNIVAVNMLAYDLFMDRLQGKQFDVDLYFESGPEGMFFTLALGPAFLDMAALFEKALKVDPMNPDVFDGAIDQVLMMRLMADDVRIKGEEEQLQFVFYVTGVNELLTNQRIELLDKYFSRLTQYVAQA